MRLHANFGEVWRTHNPIFTITSLAFTRVSVKVPSVCNVGGLRSVPKEGVVWALFHLVSVLLPGWGATYPRRDFIEGEESTAVLSSTCLFDSPAFPSHDRQWTFMFSSLKRQCHFSEGACEESHALSEFLLVAVCSVEHGESWGDTPQGLIYNNPITKLLVSWVSARQKLSDSHRFSNAKYLALRSLSADILVHCTCHHVGCEPQSSQTANWHFKWFGARSQDVNCRRRCGV